MRREFIFLHVESLLDVPECRFSVKNSSWRCWLYFRLFLWWAQKEFWGAILTSLKVRLSAPKIIVCLLQRRLLKNDEKCFIVCLKSSFSYLNFLFWYFGHVENTAWLERKGHFKNFWCRKLVDKKLQYTYWPISHEVKATRQSNLVS